MLAVLSPAKRLDFSTTDPLAPVTKPQMQEDAVLLVKQVRKLRRSQLQQLMKLSDSLTDLNFERFKAFADQPGKEITKAAALTFAGDTYLGLDAPSLDKADREFAQDHIRILSGLYGLLRPMDLIQPYRLEMGTHLKNKAGSDLYDFWGDKLALIVEQELSSHDHPVLINLASNEYFKVLQKGALKTQVITPVFQQVKEGRARTLGMFAKKARGLMARFLIKQRATNPEDLKAFDLDGYAFQEQLSDQTKWVFHRDQ
jgi:cytoplasmic iron level regulating protein YaaA (DUF328/UPF0246 family)